ncbi:MAG: PaaX family transcriptional regulator C-terminal domain-containing protein, partial [Trebonia sp.]
LAARCWDLDALGADYAGYIKALRVRLPDYQRGDLDARGALVERVRLVQDYRRFARRDPQFPAELQPAGWPGDEAHRLFQQAHSLLAGSSAEHYAELLGAV